MASHVFHEIHLHINWQRGYGVVSFGKNNLAWVLEYVGNQKEHHARGNAHDRLERTTSDEEGGSHPPRGCLKTGREARLQPALRRLVYTAIHQLKLVADGEPAEARLRKGNQYPPQNDR